MPKAGSNSRAGPALRGRPLPPAIVGRRSAALRLPEVFQGRVLKRPLSIARGGRKSNRLRIRDPGIAEVTSMGAESTADRGRGERSLRTADNRLSQNAFRSAEYRVR